MTGLSCPVNARHKVCLVEYSWDDPYHYDGISEIYCYECKKRFGRWSKKELAEGEKEPRYGIEGYTKRTVDVGTEAREKPI